MWRLNQLSEAIVFASPFERNTVRHILFQLAKVLFAGRLLAIPLIRFLNAGGF